MTDIAESIGILMDAHGRGDIVSWRIDADYRTETSVCCHYTVTVYPRDKPRFVVGCIVDDELLPTDDLSNEVIGDLLNEAIDHLKAQGVLKE